MNLKDILRQAKYEIMPDKEINRQKILSAVSASEKKPSAPARKRTMRYWAWGAVSAASLALLAGIGFFSYRYFSFDPSNNIIGDIASLSQIVYAAPRTVHESGVSTDTTVDIVTQNHISTQELERCVSVTPSVEYTIRKKGVNRFSLSFDEPLENDTSYTINSLSSGSIVYRWSLQTEKKFGITNVYPSKSEDYVDVNSTVEITFSESSVNELQAFFSISPEVKGTFRHNGRTWIFAPEQEFSPYTTYTVTIAGDIAGLEEKSLGEDYVFSFTTGYSEEKFAYVSTDGYDIADTFLSDETPVVKVIAHGITSNTADITVYRIPDAQAYIALHEKYDDTAVVSASIADDIIQKGFEIHSKFSASAFQVTEEGDETYYFHYPKNLETGYYVSEIIWNNIKLYQFIQSTDLAAYAAASNGGYSVWVNNTQNKLPLEKAEVTLDEESALTDENGLAFFENVSSSKRHHIIKITAKTLVPYVIFMPSRDINPKVDYYSYFYTNSVVYRKTDTVKIWGCILKRNASAAIPNAVIYADWTEKDYPVTPDKNGAFSLEIPIENYRLSNMAELSLKINNVCVYTKVLSIEDYDLPSYSLTADSNKNAYFAGETATNSVTVQYYDGTPAADLTVSAENHADVVTDNTGSASFCETVSVDNDVLSYMDSSGQPYVDTLYWHTDTALEQSFFTTSARIIFNNREYIHASLKQNENSTYALEIETKAIRLDKLNALSDSELSAILYDIPESYYAGASVNKALKVEMHQVTYERKKIGTTYDSVNKKVVAAYEFTPKDNVVKTYDVATSDGKALLNDIKVSNSDGYCYLKLTMTDSSGKEAFTKVYVSPQNGGYRNSYLLEASRDTVNEGDEVVLTVKSAGTLQTVSEGSLVCHLINDRIVDTIVSSSPAAQFTFEQKHKPDINVYGAYFDGKYIYPLEYHGICFDTAAKSLNISMTPDQKSYAPGDTVTLKLSVTDSTGAPASASYNINIMDQALLDSYENDHDILSAIYRNISMENEVDTFASHRDFADRPKGEGGGGGSEPRSDFEDTPAFISGRTDADGKAEITFELSDSITKWVAIAQAVTADAKAGSGQIDMVSTKDLFISTNRNVRFKTSDDAVIALKCDGKAVSTADTADTTAVLYSGEKEVASRSINHAVFQTQYLNFGKLSAGSYTLKISSRCKDKTDAVEYDITVSDSTLDVVTVSDDLKSGDSVSELVLMDENRQSLVDTLDRLACATSSRIDQAIGYRLAEAYANAPSQTVNSNIDWSFLNSYNLDLGYGAYTQNSNTDLLVSARIAALLGDSVSNEYFAQYFDSVLGNPESAQNDVLCALWGKAALHQAVERDLAYYYADGNGFTVEQQLYFALAYAYGGNQTKANQIYQSKIKPNLKSENGLTYVENADEETMQACNALLVMLAARISSTDMPQILAYNRAHDSDIQLSYFGDIAYILEYIPLLEGKNTAKIIFADNSTKEVEYDRFSVLTVKTDVVGPISVESVQGKTAAKVKKSVSASALLSDGKKVGDIALTIPQTLTLGEIVTVTVQFPSDRNRDGGVTFALPEGLHFLGIENEAYENGYAVIGADKSKITLYGGTAQTSAVTLRLQAVLPGSFTVEPLIQVVDGLNYRSSAPLTVQITENAPQPEA